MADVPERDAPEQLDAADAPERLDGADAAGADPASADPAGADAADERRSRRPNRAGALIGVLVGLLGFGLVVQVKSNQSDPGLATARQDDLVRILDDLDARKERLRQEVSSLEVSREQINSGVAGREAALDEARRRADELGILSGTLAAEGPGLSIGLIPGTGPIRAEVVLDAVEELRGAGAEAMELSGSDGTAVRIVASSYFVDDGDELLVDGQRLSAPYTISVIGDPDTMRAALNIPGGVGDTVRRKGGSVVVHEPDVVEVDALRQVHTPRYARPAS